MKRRLSTLLGLSVLVGSMAAAEAAPSYRIVEVRFPVADNFEPTTINSKLQFAVSIDSPPQNHLWLGSNGQYAELSIPASEGTIEVRGLNDRSEILGLGYHDPNVGYDHGFIWRRGQFEDRLRCNVQWLLPGPLVGSRRGLRRAFTGE